MISEFAKNEQPRRKRRGIKRKNLNAPRGGELILYPPQEDSSAAGGLNCQRFHKIEKTQLLASIFMKAIKEPNQRKIHHHR